MCRNNGKKINGPILNFWNNRKTWGPLMVTGATAPPPAPGSCPLLPVSTVSPLDQTFGALRFLTSPPGVLASATHMIRLLRWVFQPKNWLSHFSARLNQEYLGSCMHCWDISELLFLPFFFCIFHRKTFTRDKVVFVDEFLGFNIYLHDKGQFWPGLEMGEFISFQKLGNWWCKMADPMCFQVGLG